MNISHLLVDVAKWNYNNIQSIRNTFSLKSLTNPKGDISYSVFLITFSIFIIQFEKWVEEKLKETDEQPHSITLHGKEISDSATCNPLEEDFTTIAESIRTITDIRK